MVFKKVPIKSQLEKALCHKILALCHKLYEISAKSTIKSQLENTLFFNWRFSIKNIPYFTYENLDKTSTKIKNPKKKPRQNLDKTSTKPRQKLFLNLRFNWRFSEIRKKIKKFPKKFRINLDKTSTQKYMQKCKNTESQNFNWNSNCRFRRNFVEIR